MMKKFIMGLILGAGLMFSFSAHAEVVNLVGQVIEGQFKIKYEGQELENQALVVNGTSYLPVKAIADLMGLEATFDADLGIELKKKTLPADHQNLQHQPEVDIEELKEDIENLNLSIRITERTIISLENQNNDPRRVPWDEEVIEAERKKLADLEAEKAELEAQLAQLETP